MQEYIKMAKENEPDSSLVKIKQPDEGMGYDLETTYTEDTDRLQNGVLYLNPMFTVEAFSYKASNLTKAEMSQLLSYVGKGHKFKLHYFSPYHGAWRTDLFYVGKGNLLIGRLNEDNEVFDEITIQLTGVNPL